MTTSDRIEKQIILRAPRSRVWKAIVDSEQFGTWFGMKVEGPFLAGKTVKASIMPTQVDPEIAKSQKEFEGLPFELLIDRIEPEHLFSFRWHPFGVDKSVDYSHEPTTLVTFELSEASGGILLKVTESGFDKLPPERRAKAFAANEGGWAIQMKLVEKFLAQST